MAYQTNFLIRPLNNAPHSGDVVGVFTHADQTLLCVIDGLGHGAGAEKAAQLALKVVKKSLGLPLETLFLAANEALIHSRGAAMSVVLLDPRENTATYGGIGNVRGLLVSEKRQHHFSSDYGIVGGGWKRFSVETVAYQPGDWVILFTDGLSEALSLSHASKLLSPEELCKALMDTWGSYTDDAAVLSCFYALPQEEKVG